MRQSTYLWLFAVLWIYAQQCGATLFSQTAEYKWMTDSYKLCPNSDKDLRKTGVSNFTQYKRQYKLGSSVHKRLLDSADGVKAHHRGLFDKIYDYSIIIPSLAVQQGWSTVGETSRLERFLNKLLQGDPVKIAAIGGSVTVGHNVQNKQTAWLYRVYDWVNSTFPHPDHQFINKAIPAVTSAYVAPCVQNMLPDDLDLIFLEFSYNDGEREKRSATIADPTRVGLERLIRKLMSFESKPAIVNYHYHPLSAYSFKDYWYGSENTMEMLFKYYGIPSISLRTGLHQLLNSQTWLKDQVWFRDDPVHPTCVGHKFMADLVIGLLQDLSAHILATSCCHPSHQPNMAELFSKLPAPLLSGVLTQKQREKCYFDDNFKALENGIQGYQWVDEGRNAHQHKYGFVSWKPHEAIVIKVPVEEIESHMVNRTALVALGVMESYQHMGYIRISCVDGCSCKDRQVNSHNPSPYSLTYWKAIEVRLDEGQKKCNLYIENLEKTMSGEHKTKITSLLISSDPHSFIESWSNDDDPEVLKAHAASQ